MFKDGDCSLFRRENNDCQFFIKTAALSFVYTRNHINNLGDSRITQL